MPEARALLVRPVDELDRRLGDDVEVVEAAHDLEAGEDPERAVELAARGLAVEVAAAQPRQAARVAALPAPEHVADLVDAHAQASRLAPLLE